MRVLVVTAIAAVLVVGSQANSASAQGIIDIHAKVRVGGKLCLADHFHDGSSAGQPSKKAAEIVAIRVWQEFTGWEYGSAWGSFRNAASQGSRCWQTGGSWSCEVKARPCKSLR